MPLLESGPLLIIVFVFLLLFGASAIPKLARSLGQAKGEFNRAKKEFDAEAARSEAGVSSTGPASVPAAGSLASSPSEDQVRRTARDLGIAEQGRPIDEVKRLIQQKLA